MATPFLSDATVRRLRAKAVASLTARCTVERRGTSTGPYVAVPALSGLACSFAAEAATNESVAADTTIATTRFLVRFDPDALPDGLASVRSTDRLRITHTRPGIPSPLVLDVVGDQPGGAFEITRRVVATRTTAGG